MNSQDEPLHFIRNNNASFSSRVSVGFSRNNNASFSDNIKPKPNQPPKFGPNVNEPQKTIEINTGSSSVSSPKLPFHISATPALLKAEPGVVGSTSISAKEVVTPADGSWYFYAKVVINATTGGVVSEDAVWGNTIPADTSTDYHREIGSVEVLLGEVVGPPMSLQFTYGPIAVVVGGGFSSVWTVRML